MARQNKKPVPKQKSFWKRCVKYRSLILMSLPGLIAVFIFSYIPMYGILIAFQDYNPVEGMFGTTTGWDSNISSSFYRIPICSD